MRCSVIKYISYRDPVLGREEIEKLEREREEAQKEKVRRMQWTTLSETKLYHAEVAISFTSPLPLH